jgi:hypothetical protein
MAVSESCACGNTTVRVIAVDGPQVHSLEPGDSSTADVSSSLQFTAANAQ